MRKVRPMGNALKIYNKNHTLIDILDSNTDRCSVLEHNTKYVINKDFSSSTIKINRTANPVIGTGSIVAMFEGDIKLFSGEVVSLDRSSTDTSNLLVVKVESLINKLLSEKISFSINDVTVDELARLFLLYLRNNYTEYIEVYSVFIDSGDDSETIDSISYENETVGKILDDIIILANLKTSVINHYTYDSFNKYIRISTSIDVGSTTFYQDIDFNVLEAKNYLARREYCHSL